MRSEPEPTGALRGAALRGLALMLAAVALLTLMDALVKLVSARYPVAQAMALRNLVALPFLAVALRLEGGLAALRGGRHGLQLLRALLGFATGVCFFYALALLPLSEALAISFGAPFLAALLAGPLLGERIGPASWIAIALGLLGVLVVLRPGLAVVQPGALLAVGAAAFYAANTLVLRRLGASDPASVTALWGTTVAALLAVPLDPWSWRMPAASDLPVFLAIGSAGAAGTLLIAAAFRLAPVGLLTPLEYSALLWALLFDLLLFGVLPEPIVLLGAAIVVSGGLALSRSRP